MKIKGSKYGLNIKKSNPMMKEHFKMEMQF